MAFNIFRPLNQSEKKDMTQIGATEILDTFLKEVTIIKTKYQKLYRPFDFYSARIDFDNKMKTLISSRQTNLDKNLDLSIDFGDLDKYADIDRFNFIEKTVSKETLLVAGIKTEVTLGYRYTFRGKINGNKITIYVPSKDKKLRPGEFSSEDMDKFIEDEFSDKEKVVKIAGDESLVDRGEE